MHEVVLQAREAGPDARARLAEKLAEGDVNLDELEADLGLSPYEEPKDETEDQP